MKNYCTTPGVSDRVGGSVGVSKMLKFYVKVFYVMGKAQSGELSCTGTGLVSSPAPEPCVVLSYECARRASCVSFASASMKEIYIRSNI